MNRIIVLMLFCASINLSGCQAGCTFNNSNHVAYQYYQEARQFYDGGKYAEAADKLTSALEISLEAERDGVITTTETCRRLDSGPFGPVQKTVERITTYKDYHAFELMRQSRLQIPPRPIVLVQFIDDRSGLVAQMDGSHTMRVAATLSNEGGKSPLTDFILHIGYALSSRPVTVGQGKNIELLFSENNFFGKTVSFTTSEKYGFQLYEVK